MMTKLIKTRIIDDKFVIELNNPPVNAESIELLTEIYNVVKNCKEKIIVIYGNQKTRNGRNIFSAGGDREELKSGKTYKLASLINQIAKYLNTSDRYVVTIIAGDAVGGGWGMPFDISDEIYFLKDSKLISGFTRNKITPGCGNSLLIKTLGSKNAYELIKSEEAFNFNNLEKIRPEIFKAINRLEDVKKFIKSLKIKKKKAPHLANGKKFISGGENLLKQLINELIENPKKYNEIQLKYIRKSLNSQ